jgi:hypothetical protein
MTAKVRYDLVSNRGKESAENRSVDLFLVADSETAGRLLGDEDRVVHLATRKPTFLILPPSKGRAVPIQLRKLFLDLPL